MLHRFYLVTLFFRGLDLTYILDLGFYRFSQIYIAIAFENKLLRHRLKSWFDSLRVFPVPRIRVFYRSHS